MGLIRELAQGGSTITTTIITAAVTAAVTAASAAAVTAATTAAAAATTTIAAALVTTAAAASTAAAARLVWGGPRVACRLSRDRASLEASRRCTCSSSRARVHQLSRLSQRAYLF